MPLELTRGTKARAAVLALVAFLTPNLAVGQTAFDLKVREVELAECRARANPRWLAVTVVELQRPAHLAAIGGPEDKHRGEWIIDRCEVLRIQEPATADEGAGRGGAHITVGRSLGDIYYYLLVVESPKEICAALADCAVAGPR